MKNNKYVLNTLLAGVVFVAMAVMLVLKTIQPAAVLPVLNIPNMVLLSLIALVMDHYVSPNAPRCYICVSVFGALTFGLIPLAGGFADLNSVWKLAVVGGAVFAATTWLFSSMADRLSSGPRARAAAVVSALGLYLAAQCFAGIIL